MPFIERSLRDLKYNVELVMSVFRKAVPWWLRIGTKIVLSRLPLPYSFWKRLHLFEHGDMNQPLRSLENFLYHAKSANVLDEKPPLPYLEVDGDFNVLELGPGDSLFTIVIAKALGASRTWLVDAAPFAKTDMAAYDEMLAVLRQKGYILPLDNNSGVLADLLKECNGEYLTGGIQSLAQVPSKSIDFCFSQTVLQHIPKSDFNKLAEELFRVLKPHGVCHHRVDLKDMLGGGLNNLRFSEAMWESVLFCKSGFYTNRIRFKEMIGVFEQAGFICTLPRVVRWERLPTPRDKLDPSFRQLTDDDLLVSGFDVLLKK
jgi:SAM-dependent methyltransferase